MSGVMDINYILCEPSKSSPPYTMNPISSCVSSVCSSPDSASASFSPPQTPPSDYHRRRVQSESWHTNHFMPRQRSLSYSQTRTPWTPHEDSLLCFGYQQGLSWAMISASYLPHRSRGCCWGRFKTLQNKNMVDIAKRPWKVTRN